jgi:hypothetical protein
MCLSLIYLVTELDLMHVRGKPSVACFRTVASDLTIDGSCVQLLCLMLVPVECSASREEGQMRTN